MKRKEFHDIIDDDLSFPSRSTKAMRLDGCQLLSITEEDPSIRAPLRLEYQQRPLPTPTTSNAPSIDANTMPSSQDRAIVLYNPSSTPFFKSPTSPDFSIIINSDFFPGLKDCLFWPQDPGAVKSMWNKVTGNGSTTEPNDCLAVVPWVAPQLLLTSGTETGTIAPLQPMEAEDVEGEMMDTDDNSVSTIVGKAFQDGEMLEGAEAFELWQQQQQKQHCLMPQFSQSMYNPVTW
ncbi:uncharacterized protein LOC111286258 [Durio zibethinus]|uniref:Uncharacterized protein LOC111286258 n=1 Tax=Durio zibethinus TaxID=66656 RepID=A0A6P5XV59_DURZI|nr:uncharacterized protein LOC111286258 [Durio zibethinus]